MKKAHRLFTALIIVLVISSCHRKTSPGSESRSSTETATTKPAAKKVRTPVPKVITVNDNAARKTFDGRLYYDLDGHRYWRNNKDGKYYIYSKSMNTDPAFKKP